MDRRKTGDVLFYALQCAKSDRLSFIDAWAHIPNAVEIREAEIHRHSNEFVLGHENNYEKVL